jgi:hypothetical protein
VGESAGWRVYKWADEQARQTKETEDGIHMVEPFVGYDVKPPEHGPAGSPDALGAGEEFCPRGRFGPARKDGEHRL